MSKKNLVLNEEFYINEIGVLDWMYDENQYQKIRLEKDKCFHYKFNNQLHRVDGPAIVYFNETGDQFYLYGQNVSWEYHTNNKRGETLDNTIGPQKTPDVGVLVDNNTDSEDII
jgi:hypothetical protein